MSTKYPIGRQTGYYPGQQGVEPIPKDTTTVIVTPIKRQTGTSDNPNSPNYNPTTTATSRSGGRRRRRKGGKWSLKYKRSINCRRPKGFSQRQHCKRKTRRH